MSDALFMERCFQLAQKGAGRVSPNPLVGAVLVHQGQIIAEGWHEQWGAPHAEVNCLNNVPTNRQHLIPESTLYCNLEPCAHYGKTPPCAELIVHHKISTVVIANTDPNPLVAGKGIQMLRHAGIEVRTRILEQQGAWLNRSFFTWIQEKRPFVVLKWAQSADGYLGLPGQRTPISGKTTQRLVHRWRAEADAIMVGTKTALIDNPRLDNRYFTGKAPLRIFPDFKDQIPEHYHLMDDSQDTWLIGRSLSGSYQRTQGIQTESPFSVNWLLEKLYAANKAILLVEGGRALLQQFIAQGLWDELRIIENPVRLKNGLKAPEIPESANLVETMQLEEDVVRIFAAQNGLFN
ncbi:MAG: bifunctional diaminohydroxyphosphoribosylaminopyrimidine deaminase/5-amino-6-(5-phosphoribosylamino)uracil reductase RibD [Saprospiraceae bacterium]|nr:bifunctional diaminohydroxyphosphoribosylaminopyrimidine deaminase/5-amino-6-(5-phosphoribosylamino)uracil reductase RibD [Saprospiraceae bacterium]